jgi:hypothetical protein
MADEPDNPAEDEEARDYEDDLMPWEEAAHSLVRAALSTVEIDEEEGVVRLVLDGHEEEFDDFDELRHSLVSEADNEIVARVPFEDGSPVFSISADSIVDRLLAGSSAERFFEGLRPHRDENQLLLTFDYLLEELARTQVRIDVTSINEELVRYLAKHPEQMRELHPRKFEELVAELFHDMGYEVALTPQTRDGGIDFKAFRKEPFGTLLTLVECKRYRPDRRIGVGVVRALHGVLGVQHASHGVIVTTSFFTRDAKAEQQLIRGRMSLSDFNALTDWLAKYRRSR